MTDLPLSTIVACLAGDARIELLHHLKTSSDAALAHDPSVGHFISHMDSWHGVASAPRLAKRYREKRLATA